jgi:predicted TPR repeat methyltransferase
VSSGNLTADRRFAYAQLLRRDSDSGAAVEVLTQAMELVPMWAEGQFTLAEALTEAGNKYDAIAAFEAYLKIDPADSMGASLKLALLNQNAHIVLSGAYLSRLFDEYAPRFEKTLLEKLLYRAPQILRESLDTAQPTGRFTRMFDLGCGTGLAGAALKDRVDWLGGVDFSAAMVKGAALKGIYDVLTVGDMGAALSALDAPCDLIVASDVLGYVGNLETLFETVKTRLLPLGLFAFTAQSHEGDGFVLGTDHRFNHSGFYLGALAREKGFTVVLMNNAVSRQEKGVDVPGLVAVLRA